VVGPCLAVAIACRATLAPAFGLAAGGARFLADFSASCRAAAACRLVISPCCCCCGWADSASASRSVSPSPPRVLSSSRCAATPRCCWGGCRGGCTPPRMPRSPCWALAAAACCAAAVRVPMYWYRGLHADLQRMQSHHTMAMKRMRTRQHSMRQGCLLAHEISLAASVCSLIGSTTAHRPAHVAAAAQCCDSVADCCYQVGVALAPSPPSCHYVARMHTPVVFWRVCTAAAVGSSSARLAGRAVRALSVSTSANLLVTSSSSSSGSCCSCCCACCFSIMHKFLSTSTTAMLGHCRLFNAVHILCHCRGCRGLQVPWTEVGRACLQGVPQRVHALARSSRGLACKTRACRDVL
jgi:hypothetical protein